MHTARTLLIATLAAITALALTATSALAAHLGAGEQHAGATLEVIDEASGNPCTDVTKDVHTIDGGCEITAHSDEISLIGHGSFGIEVTDMVCDVEYAGHVDANGEGWIDQALYVDPTVGAHGEGDCIRTPCTDPDTGEMIPWPIHGDEELGETEVQLEFCIENLEGSDPRKCLVDIPIAESSAHHYSSGAFHAAGTPHPTTDEPCEVEVTDAAHALEIEGTAIELVH